MNTIQSPSNPIATPPSDMKGGPGVYDGVKVAGVRGRTSSPNAVPEKTMDSFSPPPKKDSGVAQTPGDQK